MNYYQQSFFVEARHFECYDLCSDGWQYFLGSLQQLIETGRGTPYELAPADVT